MQSIISPWRDEISPQSFRTQRIHHRHSERRTGSRPGLPVLDWPDVMSSIPTPMNPTAPAGSEHSKRSHTVSVSTLGGSVTSTPSSSPSLLRDRLFSSLKIGPIILSLFPKTAIRPARRLIFPFGKGAFPASCSRVSCLPPGPLCARDISGGKEMLLKQPPFGTVPTLTPDSWSSPAKIAAKLQR